MNSRSPWRRADVLTLPLPFAIGVACLGLAWADGSSGLTVAHQTDPLNLGVAGVIVAGAANVFWLLSGRRRVALRRERLARLLAARAGDAPVVAAEAASDRLLVGLPGVRFAHRPGCPLLAGKAVEPAGDDDGRIPCGVCRP